MIFVAHNKGGIYHAFLTFQWSRYLIIVSYLFGYYEIWMRNLVKQRKIEIMIIILFSS